MTPQEYTDFFSENIFFTDLALENFHTYTTKIYLRNLTLNFNFTYNNRLNRRYLTVTSIADDILLPRTQLNANNLYELNINSEILGEYVVVKFGTLNRSYEVDDYLNWANTCIIQITHYATDVKNLAETYLVNQQVI